MDMKKGTPILDPQRIGLVEDGKRQDWVVTAEEGTTPEMVADPAYWAHVSARMSPFDHIEVRCEDGSWVAEYIVLGCDRNWARVHLKHEYKLTTADVSLTQASKHEVKWKGPHLMFAVIRLSDQQSVMDKFPTKEAAGLWLREHERTTA